MFSAISRRKKDRLQLPAFKCCGNGFWQTFHICNQRAGFGKRGILPHRNKIIAVSYTHLDVYKRQEIPYQEMSGNPYQQARFYECGTYGPGYAVNADRRQISPAQADKLLSVFGLTDTEPLPGADAPDEPDTPSGGGSSSLSLIHI